MSEPLVTADDLREPVCGCGHFRIEHLVNIGCQFCYGGSACARTPHEVLIGHWDAVVRREVARAWDRGYRDGESAATGSIRAGARLVIDNPYRAIEEQS